MVEKVEAPKKLNAEELEQELANAQAEDTTKGERHYARKFKSVYQVVRKSLVAISKARSTIGSEQACEKVKEVLDRAYNELE